MNLIADLLKASPDELEAYRVRAKAEIAKRKTEGTWSGGVVPHTEYQTRPLDWIVEKLGVPRETIEWSLHPKYHAESCACPFWCEPRGHDGSHQWDGDVDPLAKALKALADEKDCGIEGSTGPGKTYMAACIVFWFLACFEDAIVVTVAPKADQLLKHIWKEIGDLWPRFERLFPQAELLPGSGVLRMRPDEEGREKWSAFAFVCGVGASEEVATKAQGFHSEHMLIITEETPGIHTAIMSALFNTRTDDHNLQLALGNPDHRNDSLHRFCFDENEQPRPNVVHVRMSALDHPNIVTGERVVPGTLGRRRLEDRIRELGKDTRLYGSRVRGLCPAEAEDALIKWEWCVSAAKRWEDQTLRDGGPALGVDVADSPTGDEAAIADGEGACLIEVEAWHVRADAEEVAEKVYLKAMDPRRPIEQRRIGLDNVGVGASAYNRLNRMGLKVRKLSGATKAVPLVQAVAREEGDEDGPKRPRFIVESERYKNTRSQVWWLMREDLRLGRIALPYDEGLWQDLCTPTYTTENGKIAVEDKEGIKKRLGRSPNKGDAACYWNYVRPRPSVRRRESVVAPREPADVDRGLERFVARQDDALRHERRQQNRVLKRLKKALKGRAS